MSEQDTKERIISGLGKELICSDLNVDEKIELIKELKVAIPNKLDSILKNLKEIFWQCPKCKRHFLKDTIKQITKKRVDKHVTVYKDSAFGDEDEYADVTYLVVYDICPNCEETVSTGKQFYLKEENRRDRFGAKIERN